MASEQPSNLFFPHTEEEYENLKNSGKLLVVDYWAVWCKPCKAIKPQFRQLSTEHPDVDFAQVDIHEFEEVDEIKVLCDLPLFRFFRNGNLVHETIKFSEVPDSIVRLK
eukprot:TRINITY_DN1730_c0_g2_i1.p1 TRINITY_DN1730_c0_g2~~TRINITY_DN1730_c0_g2_i1.p1  ORF type:complete len:109 (+),score=12.20 TRINITY_DN1730_c0_g2_i1:109-435(+)